MPCYKPIGCVQKADGTISFRPEDERFGRPLQVPCGKCIGCRLEYSRQWALRCVHESKQWDQNCWVTLTYDEDNLPYAGSLVKDDMQKFMKRLRRRHEPNEIRFYGCGEYGDKGGRPHYHICLFNHDFSDSYFWRYADGGQALSRSPLLEDIWPYGHSEIGELTFETAAYTARYVTKKVTGEKASEHYTRILLDGRMVEVEPEFALMSRRPGIGSGHYEQYRDEIYPRDECIARGVRCKPPRYYDRLLEAQDESTWEKIKTARRDYAESHKEETTPHRLKQRQRVKQVQISRLKRSLED